MAQDNSCSRHHRAPSYFPTRRDEKVRFNWRKRRRGANSRPFDGTRCEMRMNFIRGCKSFSFYNPAGEFLPHVRLSISLSLSYKGFARVGVEASRSIQTHCGVSSMEIRKGSGGETTDERMKTKSMVHADMVGQPEDGLREMRSFGRLSARFSAIVRTLVSQESLNYFASFEPRQRSLATGR